MFRRWGRRGVLRRVMYVQVVRPGERTRRVLVGLGFDAADPIAVTLTIGGPGGDQIVWRFARRLLAEGTRRPVGLGDVRVRPAVAAGASALALRLSSPSGLADLELPAAEVIAFLWRSFAMVPADAEVGRINWVAEFGFLPGGPAAPTGMAGRRRTRGRFSAGPHHAGT
ncbi:SsgA family sporulation/cell division regulator [Frankia sp. R82]|uniref:SsgA family sporulation/cell division regulator n=1 Tax=Frankia sp. R82 TaxID=2950553 RepID=UPI0020449F01|nr:SsgA family sporulation/cell division regulator [Frankia sp. R82]MCM3885630.1 SsgA family sporulation/cell division regulator [Frankia sp. R82]